MQFIKPKIIISKCLEFDACRYDGQIISNNYINDLKQYVDFRPICPEVEIGMGIPREPVRIIYDNTKVLLYQDNTGIDFSNKMNNFSKKFISTINKVDGFILKSSSPSCGINSTKIYIKGNSLPTGKGSGIFTSTIISNFPYHPKEEDDKFNNAILREHFFTSIFTLADFRRVKDFETLYKYHSKHKYLLMAHNQMLMKKMGQIAANRNNKILDEIINEYYRLLLLLLSKKSSCSSNINVQMHMMGYFKEFLTLKEKKMFLDTVNQYRSNNIQMNTVNEILSSWIVRFENKFLMNQSFFHPFPKKLIDKLS